MFKCKLCGSEVAINQYPHTQVQISGDRCCCPNGDCNLHLVSLTKSEWQKLNATWIPVEEKLPEHDNWVIAKTSDYDYPDIIGYCKAKYIDGEWNCCSTNFVKVISWMEEE